MTFKKNQVQCRIPHCIGTSHSYSKIFQILPYSWEIFRCRGLAEDAWSFNLAANMYIQQWCFCSIRTFELLTFKEKGGHVDPDQELLCSNLSQSICSWPPSHKRVASSMGKDLGSKLGKKKAISFLKMQTSEKDKIQHREQAVNLIPGSLLWVWSMAAVARVC